MGCPWSGRNGFVPRMPFSCASTCPGWSPNWSGISCYLDSPSRIFDLSRFLSALRTARAARALATRALLVGRLQPMLLAARWTTCGRISRCFQCHVSRLSRLSRLSTLKASKTQNSLTRCLTRCLTRWISLNLQGENSFCELCWHAADSVEQHGQLAWQLASWIRREDFRKQWQHGTQNKATIDYRQP